MKLFFSCEYCEIFKSNYFEKHLKTAASVDYRNFYRSPENQIIVYFEQMLQLVLVLLLLTLNK